MNTGNPFATLGKVSTDASKRGMLEDEVFGSSIYAIKRQIDALADPLAFMTSKLKAIEAQKTTIADDYDKIYGELILMGYTAREASSLSLAFVRDSVQKKIALLQRQFPEELLTASKGYAKPRNYQKIKTEDDYNTDITRAGEVLTQE